MGLPCVRFTVRRLMVVVAILAVSWSMCLGIGHLGLYWVNSKFVRDAREEATIWEKRAEDAGTWEKRREAGEAAEWWLRQAEEVAGRNSESLANGVTALILVTVGIVSGGLGLSARAWYRTWNSARPCWVDVLADACLSLSASVLVGFALGCIAYVGIFVFVVTTSE
jgi:hypothetical protein